jgi:hypothetical protein
MPDRPYRKLRPVRDLILPASLIVMLVVIMTGCIYIPTWDHTLLTGTKSDFRGWTKEHQSQKQEQLHAISRAQIESLFGQPAFASASGSCVAYVMGTEHNIIVYPLCFGAGFGEGDVQVLKLVYDKDNHLKKVVPLSSFRRPVMYTFGNSVGAWGEPEPESRAIHFLRRNT